MESPFFCAIKMSYCVIQLRTTLLFIVVICYLPIFCFIGTSVMTAFIHNMFFTRNDKLELYCLNLACAFNDDFFSLS